VIMSNYVVRLFLISTIFVRGLLVFFLILLGQSFIGDPVFSWPWFLWSCYVALADGMFLSVILRPLGRYMGFA